MTSPESASPARRDRFVEWSTRVEPVIGFAMATVGCVLIANEVAGQGWVTPAALDPYVAVLPLWGSEEHPARDDVGFRRVLAFVSELRGHKRMAAGAGNRRRGVGGCRRASRLVPSAHRGGDTGDAEERATMVNAEGSYPMTLTLTLFCSPATASTA